MDKAMYLFRVVVKFGWCGSQRERTLALTPALSPRRGREAAVPWIFGSILCCRAMLVVAAKQVESHGAKAHFSREKCFDPSVSLSTWEAVELKRLARELRLVTPG
jgi:hypothetical protein